MAKSALYMSKVDGGGAGSGEDFELDFVGAERGTYWIQIPEGDGGDGGPSFPYPFTARSFMFYLSQNDNTGTVRYSLAKGSVDETASVRNDEFYVDVPAGATGWFKVVDSYDYEADRGIELHCYAMDGAGSHYINRCAVELDPTDPTKCFSVVGAHSSGSGAQPGDPTNTTWYYGLFGQRVYVESNPSLLEFEVPFDCTIENQRMFPGQVGRDDGVEVYLNKNGTNTAILSTMYSADDSTVISDYTNVVSAVQGDGIISACVLGPGPDGFSYENNKLSIISTEDKFFTLVGSNTNQGTEIRNNSHPSYRPGMGGLSSVVFTGSSNPELVAMPILFDSVLSRISMRIKGTSLASGPVVMTVVDVGGGMRDLMSIQIDNADAETVISTTGSASVFGGTSTIALRFSTSTGTDLDGFSVLWICLVWQEGGFSPTLSNPDEPVIGSTTATISCDTDTP